MVVLDREGNFITSWGEGLFNRAHGLHIDADDNLYCTDDGDHTVRKCSTDGKVLLTIGIPNKPAPFMSGEPFHRCTHTALSPKGEIYVSDGYGNACVHKYSPDGKLLKTWGEPGTDPGQFNIVHNIATDADGWVYVADRENHRVQVFDGNGKYETQWNNLHRPCALCCCGGKQPNFIIGELGPGMAGQPQGAQSRPAALDRRCQGQAHRPARRRERPGLEAGKFLAPHGIALDSEGRYLCRRSRRHRLEDQLSGHADAAGGEGEPLPAEAGEDLGGRRYREVSNARTCNARQHRRRAQRRGNQPRAELRDGGPRGCRVKPESGRLPQRWAWAQEAPSFGAAALLGLQSVLAGGAGALCSPQGPRRSVPLLPGLSHIQICAAASRGCRRQRQRQQPARSCVLAGPHDTAEQPEDSHRLCKRVRRFSPASFSPGFAAALLAAVFLVESAWSNT